MTTAGTAPDERELLDTVLQAIKAGAGIAVCTVVGARGTAPCSPGTKSGVRSDGSLLGTLGDRALEARVIRDAQDLMRSGRSQTLTYCLPLDRSDGKGTQGELEIFIEVLQAPPTFIICGAGHVAVPLAKVAKMLDFRVVVVDDRPEFATPERFPDADEVIAADYIETMKNYPIDSQTHIVLVTRGHKWDEAILREVVTSNARYIGMIGSTRRVRAVFLGLKNDGYPEETLKKVWAPIGLDIGAETPSEIAISIMGEVIKLHRGGTGMSMHFPYRARQAALAQAAGAQGSEEADQN